MQAIVQGGVEERSFNTRAVTWHYVIALGMIAILAIIGLAAMKLSLQAYQTNLQVTRLGGEQLRLFQQIGELTRGFLQAAGDWDATDSDLELMRGRILDATRRLAGNQQELQSLHQQRISGLLKDGGASYYFDDPPYELARRLADFIQQAEFIATLETPALRAGLADWAPIVLTLARHGVMIRGFDLMMAAIERDGRDQIDLLKNVMNAATGLIILTLLIEGGLIFRPLVRKLRAEHERLAQSELHLSFLAHHDALTGLANRTRFQQALEGAVERTAREGGQVTLLLIDLDKFKAVNDSYGHPAGDALLKAIGGRLSGWSRETDLAVRLGGDEFAVIMTGLKRPEQAQVVAERLMEHLTPPVIHGDVILHPRCSIGCASHPADADTIEKLIARADLAMYSAKSRSLGVCRFEPGLESEPSYPSLLEEEFRQAVDSGELLIHYQPKLSLIDGRHVGFEALARWQHPVRGLLPPSEFLGVADRAGLTPRLTEVVLNRVAADIAAWRREGLRPGVVAVDMAGAVLANHTAVFLIERALEPFDLEGACLMIEITEDVAINRTVDQARPAIEALKAIGVKIALDDFGTGYASLTHLRSFPFDEIKIDQSFIQDLTIDPRCDEIVRAILGVAKGLGKSVVAEGVETEAQEAFLIEAGCGLAQGFRYSRGLDFEAAAHRLRGVAR